MTMLLVEGVERPAGLFDPRPETLAAPADAVEQGRDGGLGGRLTLDEAIVGAWEGLAARAAVACPLCGGALRPTVIGDAVVDGRCGDCGTTLA